MERTVSNPLLLPACLRHGSWLLASCILCCLSPRQVLAEEDWSMCSVPVITRSQDVDYSRLVTEISADRLFGQTDRMLQFSGSASFVRDGQQISADRILLFNQPRRIEASGNVLFADDLLSLNSQSLTLETDSDRASFSDVEFQLFDRHLRGLAQSIEQFDADHKQISNVAFTTCDPEDSAWTLSAGLLELNHATRQGTAHDAVLRIQSLPVFYFPWMMFPLGDQRMSGILNPTLGSSSSDGTIFSLPVYWNQAANYDMTIVPVWYSKRSVQINTENRYLFEQASGDLRLSWLDDRLTDEERWYRQWRHDMNTWGGIQVSARIQRVSDSEFLDDFEGQGFPADVNYLPSSLQLSRSFAGWDARAEYLEHQTINLDTSVASRPYALLPRLTLNKAFSPGYNRFRLDWENEWANFDKRESVTGHRLQVKPSLGYPLEGDYYFLKPQLELNLTRYELDSDATAASSIERALPLLSIDSGLIFERMAGNNGDWLQTLEPRLYLLYVPYEEQQDIPDFDTALLSENYDNLFINNRFSGADRIGDSKQISLGITSRLVEPQQGREVFSASIGQAFYQSNRKVSLDNTIDERDKSSFMTLLRYQPVAGWDLQLSSVYDQDEGNSKQTDIALRHRGQQSVFNLEYHYRQDKLEQSTLSLVYPVSSRWTGFFKRQHSILKDRTVHNLAGFAYESCCWKLQLVYEEDANKEITDTDYAVYMQLTFKGLSSAGQDIGALLENGILGYSTE